MKRRIVGAALASIAMFATARLVRGQSPPNLPPPGAYQSIPNFTGVGAGAQFRKAINDRLSGVEPVAPAIARLTFANLPAEQDGNFFFCSNCKSVTPCAAGGGGAWAMGVRGQWACASGALEASLNANGNKLTNLASGTVNGDALAFGQASGGDLSGAMPNPTVPTVLGGKTPLTTVSSAGGDAGGTLGALQVNTVLAGKMPLYSTQANAQLTDSQPASVVCSSVGSVAGGGSLTFVKPACLVSGNLEVASFFTQGTTAIAPPSGWTAIRLDTASGQLVEYYHVAGASEPASYQWTWAGNQYAVGGIAAIAGANTSSPIDNSAFNSGGSSPVTVAALTIAAPSELVLAFAGGSNGAAQPISFSKGALAWQQAPGGNLPHSAGFYTQAYGTGSSVNAVASLGGATLAAAQIAIKSAQTSTSSPILQGDSYAEVLSLAAVQSGGTPSINGFNVSGVFNVKNPAYAGGARRRRRNEQSNRIGDNVGK